MSQKTMSRSADAAVSGGPADQRLVSALTLAAMSPGYGVVQLDVTIVNVAINQHWGIIRQRGRRVAMGGERLHHRLRLVHTIGRRAW
jgi:hypothetical protein